MSNSINAIKIKCTLPGVSQSDCGHMFIRCFFGLSSSSASSLLLRYTSCMQAMVCLRRTAYNRVGTHSHGDSRSEFEKHGSGCRCIDCWKKLRRLYSYECYWASGGWCWTCSERRVCRRCNRETYMTWGDCLDSDCFTGDVQALADR